MTIAYGHGIAVSPLQMVRAYGVVVNGGYDVAPTLLVRGDAERIAPKRILSEHTSHTMRGLLRLVVDEGTGRQAYAEGYLVGGKTGTAEKAGVGGYRRNASLSSFVAAFPINDPRYVVFVALDEPQGAERTLNRAGAGWTAAPTASRVISRIAPLLSIAPTTRTLSATADSLLVSVRKGG
jgi:cell division protein FtsI (penicillin-binding protein 3)